MPLNQGILNEIELERALNGHRISELNSNLRNFILTLFRPSPAEISREVVHAERTCNTRFKPDLVITFAGRTLKVSVKSGSGNSVHQEPIRTFVAYLRDQLHAPDAVINDLLFFHWGDGTLDGSGPISARLPARTIIENYPEKIATVQAFFTEHLDVLLERFLSTGIYNLGSVDWIYYGDRDSGSWQPISAVYATLKQNFSNPLSVGGLNFQTYGRSLNGQDDRRRRDIQLKWGSMAAFFLSHQTTVSATPVATIADPNLALQGLDFESSFVAMLNRDKTHPFWQNFATSNENLYLVNVSYHQTSRIAGAKVAPKSDCYVVRVEPDISQLLAENQYVLTEEILRQQNFNYQTVAHSGISLKMPSATHYTLQKLSYSAFRSLFAELSPAYFVAALLFVNVAELEKNDLIFATFQTNLDALCRELSVDQAETEVETCRRLKAQANAVITEQVNSQAELYQAICFGIGVFEDPYCASYVFAEDVLHTSQTYHPRISVTTGSGRSNGTYNLAFKTAR